MVLTFWYQFDNLRAWEKGGGSKLDEGARSRDWEPHNGLSLSGFPSIEREQGGVVPLPGAARVPSIKR